MAKFCQHFLPVRKCFEMELPQTYKEVAALRSYKKNLLQSAKLDMPNLAATYDTSRKRDK
jgi:hypothetical protein